MKSNLLEMEREGVKIEIDPDRLKAYENAGWKKVKTKPSKQKELDNGDS